MAAVPHRKDGCITVGWSATFTCSADFASAPVDPLDDARIEPSIRLAATPSHWLVRFYAVIYVNYCIVVRSLVFLKDSLTNPLRGIRSGRVCPIVAKRMQILKINVFS